MLEKQLILIKKMQLKSALDAYRFLSKLNKSNRVIDQSNDTKGLSFITKAIR